jgi:hypothetical protein
VREESSTDRWLCVRIGGPVIDMASAGEEGPMADGDFKMCRVCGGRIDWREKWARCWGRLRYCGPACRRQGLDSTDRELEDAILGLLACRHVGGTIVPSEAARLVADGLDWQALVERTISAARRLANQGRLEISWLDHLAGVSSFQGQMQLRLPRGVSAVRPAA